MSRDEEIANIIRGFGEKNFSSKSAFARAMGMSPQHLYKHLKKKNPLPIGALMRERLAFLGLTQEYISERLKGTETTKHLPSVTLINVPVYQSVSAGTKGDLIMEDVVEYIGIPKTGDTTLFGVVVKGNSMSPRVNAGDVVIVSEKAEVRNGDMAIVNWEDGEFNLRYVNYSGDNVALTSENASKYPTVIVHKKQIHRLLRVMKRIENI